MAAAPSRTRLLGGLVLWFAVLGGAVAWGLHLLAAWATDELACLAGHEEISGAPLALVITLMVVVPGALAVAALVTSWIAWRRTRTAADGVSLDRTRMLAVVGFSANLLFVAIILFDAVAVVVIPQCAS
ncbi:hypothetical protein ACWEKJ_20680 [Amycolatopsis thermoflava]|uniref:hypothetical protein n=1 Tax=Amycolatopsis thermoflava TaxID=84480 RepID=UPI003EB9520B